MASVNIDFKAFSDRRFKIVGKKLGMHQLEVIGRCSAVWMQCIEGNVECLSKELVDTTAESEGFADVLVLSNLAEEVGDGSSIRLKGTTGRIEWLDRCRRNAKKAGLSRARRGTRQKDGKFAVGCSEPSPMVELTPNHLDGKDISPSSLVSVSLPASKANTYPHDKDLECCIHEWGKTLEKFKIRKDSKFDEVFIVRLLQTYGLEKTRLALYGAGFEEKSDQYDPSKHVNIYRLGKPQLFEKFVNLGAQNQTELREFTEIKDSWNQI
jgi:hypothetical protein